MARLGSTAELPDFGASDERVPWISWLPGGSEARVRIADTAQRGAALGPRSIGHSARSDRRRGAQGTRAERPAIAIARSHSALRRRPLGLEGLYTDPPPLSNTSTCLTTTSVLGTS